ncbi:hypothetical protein ACFL5K_02350 [Gemmatimonadota bacterium]
MSESSAYPDLVTGATDSEMLPGAFDTAGVGAQTTGLGESGQGLSAFCQFATLPEV